MRICIEYKIDLNLCEFVEMRNTETYNVFCINFGVQIYIPFDAEDPL